MIIENALNVYTDGSSLSNPRSGGMGVRIIVINDEGHEEITDIPLVGYKGATNNQMELYACISGIKEAKKHKYWSQVKRVAIFSDSLYLINNHKTALYEWQKNKWRNRYGKPILNADLWKKLIKEIKSSPKKIDFHWVKGHSKNIHNKAVDKLAKGSAKGVLKPEMIIQKVRRKISNKKTILGSIKPEGQKISIRIITDEYLSIQRCYKYRYEVLSKKSPYYRNVDIIYSTLMLNAGHSYYVCLNNDIKNPIIVKCFKELKKDREKLNILPPSRKESPSNAESTNRLET